jgi:hypothetical protein
LYGPPLQTSHLQHHQTSVSTSALANNPSFQLNMKRGCWRGRTLKRMFDGVAGARSVVEGRTSHQAEDGGPGLQQLCKSFMQSFVDLVNEMRELRSMQLLPADVIILRLHE